MRKDWTIFFTTWVWRLHLSCRYSIWVYVWMV